MSRRNRVFDDFLHETWWILTWDPMDEQEGTKWGLGKGNGLEMEKCFKDRMNLDGIFVQIQSQRALCIAEGKTWSTWLARGWVAVMRFHLNLNLWCDFTTSLSYLYNGYRMYKELSPLLLNGWWLFSVYRSGYWAGKPNLSRSSWTCLKDGTFL